MLYLFKMLIYKTGLEKYQFISLKPLSDRSWCGYVQKMLCTFFLILWATSLIHTVLWAASSPIYVMWHSHGNYCNCQHGKILVAYLMLFNLAVSTSSLLGAKCRPSSCSLRWGVAEHTRICMEEAVRSTLWLLKVSKLTSRFSWVLCAAKRCKIPLADGS